MYGIVLYFWKAEDKYNSLDDNKNGIQFKKYVFLHTYLSKITVRFHVTAITMRSCYWLKY